ncbi:MAG: hypothetical protein Gaeavirus2_26 [Gaeavirus sp.]|uniref:Uncharacterized protein n=1 Tax=Gaeavirus sp. TaxID=2487767 RepID=A0A3G5A0A5_9VIRU|nr:MAG: hypothetical protein Gaeavirus2_26 [Gaeavirus sp.]
MNNSNIIERLYKNIDLSKINYKIIKHNANYLYNVFTEIQKLWDDVSYDQVVINKKEFNKIIKIANTSFLNQYDKVLEYIKNVTQIIKVTDSNITFYYFDAGSYSKDIDQINYLFNMTVTTAKYFKVRDTENIIILWLPIDINRDFVYDVIDNDTLKKSEHEYTAFTSSGVTFGLNPRYTIITRYEEIHKLLLHELIHNFYIDGSCHTDFDDVLTKYKNSKSTHNHHYQYSMYESYTELLATYITIIFRNINLTSQQEIIDKIETEIIMELLYSYNTICNLIKKNGFKTFNEFMKTREFKGDICIYEYYYLKGLMYNNYELTICNDKICHRNNYLNIIDENINDNLLEDIYNHSINQTNFRYNFYN